MVKDFRDTHIGIEQNLTRPIACVVFAVKIKLERRPGASYAG
jgi:hypothetical protein